MDRRVWRYFDFVLLGAAILLAVYGAAMVYSATRETPSLSEQFPRQIIYSVAGLLVMLAVASFDYRLLENLHKVLYVVALILLGIVFVIGEVTHGAQRWIDLKFYMLQPSELCKIVIIIGLAKILSSQEKVERLYYLLLSLIYVLVPMLLIYIQPDLGTALTVGVIWLAMALMAGMRLLHLVLLGGAGALAAPFVWVMLQDYMRDRLLLFLNPNSDPAARYNIDQALISIGSGGWLGKGFASGSQSQLHFLRVRHTDFVFSVIGEELGLLGTLLLFLLFTLLFWRILRAAGRARDPFGRLLCCGVAAMILFQTAVNIGMNLNLMPVTGIPLPFISYGGSSLITLFIGLGLVQSVVMRHKQLDFE
jgi:rod shape determining protein RodA